VGLVARTRTLLALAFLLSISCGTSAVQSTSRGPGAESGAMPTSQSNRTLVIATRAEPSTLAGKTGVAGGVTLTTTRRLFNANLVIFDQRGLAQPYLAAELPVLNTPSWQVSDDGTMETTYKLKPNLVWQDGQPLTAEDWVFSWHVYATPDLGTSTAPPIPWIDEAIAPDPQTLTIHWRNPYAHAGQMGDVFPPLPRHIMETTFESSDAATFAANPFWTQQYVGAGPYRLDKWEPGAFIEGVGFERHVLGAPKIGRIRMLFIGDPNTALANLLSGEVHIAVDDAIRFEQGLRLIKEWVPQGGTVLLKPDLWRATYFQLRREVSTAPSLTDVRVRRALSMLVDKASLNDALFEGQGLLSDTPYIPNTVEYFAQIEPLVAKYPYDPAQAQALLSQAGFARAPDGAWMTPTGGRLSFDFTTTSGSQNESELSIMAAGWRQAGLEINESIFPVAMAQDQQARSSFPALMTISLPQGEDTLAQYRSSATPRAETRWVGFNRGSWSHPDFDRAAEAFTRALDQQERVKLIAEMEQVFTGNAASIPLFFNPNPIASVPALKGPQNVAPASAIVWDIQNWELR